MSKGAAMKTVEAMEAQILNLVRERDEARAEVAADEQIIAQRDSYHEWADKLAHAIGGLDVGEHSNINNPWQNAIEMAEALHTRAEAAEKERDEAREEAANLRQDQPYIIGWNEGWDEAFSRLRFPTMLRKMWSGGEAVSYTHLTLPTNREV